MKTLKLLFRNMRTSVLRKIIVMLFVGISVCVMNITLSGYLYQENLNNTVKNSGLYDDYMFASTHLNSVIQANKSPERQFVKDKLSELQSEGLVESFCEIATFNGPYSDNIDTDRANIICYPREFATDVKFAMSKDGMWIEDQNYGKDDDCLLPMVVGYDLRETFPIGEHIDLDDIYGFSTYVIGILEKDSLVLVSNAGGNGLNLNYCFETANDKIIFGTDYKKTAPKAFVIKTNPENREYARQRVQSEIGDAYYTFSFKELSDTAYEENRLVTEKKAIVFFISLIVCLVGASSSNLINSARLKKKYAIYYFCGMELKKGVVITVIENVIQLIVPAALGYLAFLKYCFDKEFEYLRLGSANIIVTVLLIVGIFLFTALKPLIDIRRSSPVKIIGET